MYFFFPLNNTILIPNDNTICHSFLEICSNCNKNLSMIILPVAVIKAYSGNQYGSGVNINVCKDKHSLEYGFVGPLLKLQH